MIRFNGVNHLAMATGDLDGTIRFWRDLLGMRLVAGLGKPGYRQYFLQVSDRDMIAFFEWPDVRPVEEKEHGRPVMGPFAFDHVAFGVEDEEELWKLKDRLSAAGEWVSEVMDHGFIHSIYAHDPNGIPIEFSYYVPGTDLRRGDVILIEAGDLVPADGEVIEGVASVNQSGIKPERMRSSRLGKKNVSYPY